MLLHRTLTKTTILLLLFVIFAVTQSLVTRYVDWTPSGLAAINNELTVTLPSHVLLGCDNTVSNVYHTENETAYNICDLSKFNFIIGACQVDLLNISLTIVSNLPSGIQYQVGGVYYFTSKHGNDCINGQKVKLNVVDPQATSTVSTTITPTTTTTTGNTGTTGTTTGNTGTNGGTNTNTGGIQQSTATNIMGTTTIITTTTGGFTGIMSTVTKSSTPTSGGAGDSDSSSFLDKLPFKGYVVFPVVAVVIFLVLCVLMIMCLFICYRKNRKVKVELLASPENSISLTDNIYKSPPNDDAPPPYTETVDSAKEHKPLPTSNNDKSVKSSVGPPSINNKKPDPPPLISQKTDSVRNGHYKPSPNSTRGPTSLRSAPPPPPSTHNGPKSLPARADGRRQAPRPPPANRQHLPPVNSRN